MMVNEFVLELRKRSGPLFWFGVFNVFLLILAFIMFFIDPTLIKGINAWIKPMKFSVSITTYSWTFCWLMAYITKEKARKLIATGVIICMAVENILIYVQAFRGTTSHFNIHTALDGAIFSIMGIFIAINSVVILYTLFIFFSKDVHLEPVMLQAWRFGLILFFVGGISGGWMVGILSHTVGATDGGPGLPLLNWSTVAGDIRVAHFITLHGLQIIPLFAFFFIKTSEKNAGILTSIFSASYLVGCVFLHWMAYNGLPLVPA